MENIHLTEAEWSVMECLWEQSPRTGREVTQYLEKTAGWSRSTTLTLLSRLEAKGAVCADSDGGKKAFRAVFCPAEAEQKDGKCGILRSAGLHQ